MATLHSIRGVMSREMPLTLLTGIAKKPSDTNLSRQVLRRIMLGLVLVPTLLIWIAVCTGFFGYQAVNARGTSMEPTLRDGDALWVEQLDIADVKVGDIVTLGRGEESIAHRVTMIEPLSSDTYFVLTKGDANPFTEAWKVSDDETVAVMVARVPFGGYMLGFIASIFGKALLIGVVATMVVILLRRKWNYGTIS
ncbi:signal peptidase I [Chloroflexota bacterium]